MPDSSKNSLRRYGDIINILSNEKSGGDPVEVPKNFYKELREVVRGLTDELEKERNENPTSKRAEKIQKMLDNIRNQSEKFYRFRVRKIFRIAKNSPGDRLKTRGLAEEEEKMLRDFRETLDKYGYLVDFSLDEDEIRERIARKIEEQREALKSRESGDKHREASMEGMGDHVPAQETPAPQTKDEEEEETVEEKEPDKEEDKDPLKDLPMTEKARKMEVLPEKTMMVRVLDDMDTIAGLKRNYNLQREDVVVLPQIIARVLLKSAKAELIGYNL